MELQNSNFICTLLRSAKNGKISSFVELVNLTMKRNYAFSLILLGEKKISGEIVKSAYFQLWKEMGNYDIDYPLSIKIIELMMPYLIQYNESKNQKAETIFPTEIERILFKQPFDVKLIFLLHEIEKLSFDEIRLVLKTSSIEDIINLSEIARANILGAYNSCFVDELVANLTMIYNGFNVPEEIRRELSEMLYNEALIKQSQKSVHVDTSSKKIGFFQHNSGSKPVRYDAGNSWFD